jgi:uncharacterized membrane protein
MIIFFILVATFLIALLVLSRRERRPHRDAARVAMAVAMVFSGISHFVAPESFLRMLPDFVPIPQAVIIATGVVEVLLGAGLLVARRWRREVGLVLVGYLIAVFPANVYVAVAGVDLNDLGGGNPWLRLPFQAVYIAWVFWAVPDLIGPLRALMRRRQDPGQVRARAERTTAVR